MERIEKLRREEKRLKRNFAKSQAVMESVASKKKAKERKQKGDANKEKLKRLKRKVQARKVSLHKRQKTSRIVDDSGDPSSDSDSSSDESGSEPDSGEEESDKEVEEESDKEVEEESDGEDEDPASSSSDDDEMTCQILSHKQYQNGRVILKVKFSDEPKPTTAAIHHIWCDFTDVLVAYIREHKLKGGYWRRPALKNAEEIVQILEHQEDFQKYRVLFDNGYDCWAEQKDVHEDARELAKKYLEDMGQSIEAVEDGGAEEGEEDNGGMEDVAKDGKEDGGTAEEDHGGTEDVEKDGKEDRGAEEEDHGGTEDVAKDGGEGGKGDPESGSKQ